MIINSNSVQAASRLYAGSQPVKSSTRVQAAQGTSREDALELSHEAQSFGEVFAKLQGMSEVREDKLNALKNSKRDGANADDIATKLLMMRF